MKLPFDLKDSLHFSPLKDDRGAYFVEYSVPIENHRFATLELVYLQTVPTESVAKAMVAELEIWARRYPVPIMVTAFDDTGRVLTIEPIRTANHVIGWIDRDGQFHVHWRLVKDEEIPSEPFTRARLLETYADVPHSIKTAEAKRKDIERTIRQNRTIRNVVIVWFVAIPIAIALFTHFVEWAGWIATGVSLLTGVWKLASIMGWKKKTKRQQDKEANELRMKHHHYYCERNPVGFNRLKAEVLNRELRSEVLKEVEEMRKRSKK